ncbi:hypothetical protein Y032_0138g2079 [Ancylostoma ceylanicum]|uniref:Uncharacterized protein n=1 Tax=Ancylostoma ceylanicum TaxID=53326 RepID=A0A016T426_9BILA|nr:hypothetical protein Y032_0138g2079 [Ancylostoma ceylanicum]
MLMRNRSNGKKLPISCIHWLTGNFPFTEVEIYHSIVFAMSYRMRSVCKIQARVRFFSAKSNYFCGKMRILWSFHNSSEGYFTAI